MTAKPYRNMSAEARSIAVFPVSSRGAVVVAMAETAGHGRIT